MDFPVLSSVVEELSVLLAGARVDRVYQGADAGLYVIFIRNGHNHILLLSPDRAMPRLHLVTVKPAADKSPHGFILYLRSHLSGTMVSRISLLNQDRIVEIRFTGSGKEYCLIFELFGPAANLMLADPSKKILAVYFPVPPSEQTARTLLPGFTYMVPEKKKIHTAAYDTPGVAVNDTLSPNRAAELYYAGLIEQQRIVSLRNELAALLKKTLLRGERLVNALSKERHSAERIEEYRQMGDLILANLHTVKAGTEHAELLGYDGKTVMVTLDPKRSMARNAEAYFKRYKKAKAGKSIIATRLRQAEDEVLYVTSLLPALDQTSNYSDLRNLRSELDSRGYGRSATRGKKPADALSLPFKKIVFNGWEILVGKNAAGNDYITTKLARPDDLWLHAEGLPGSHILVRNPGSRDIPPAVLLKAAAIAAYYSKGRDSGTVSVTFTRAGFVRKPKGAKPGLVMLSERKSLMVKPEDG